MSTEHDGKLILYGRPGWGSAIVEVQLVWYKAEFIFETVGDLFLEPEARDALSRINPIAQIPALTLESGEVMTESAAITLYLAERVPAEEPSLAPRPGDKDRAAFLRWLIFITSNIYPTYTYADDPSRFVEAKKAQGNFATAVNELAKRYFLVLEDAAKGPWFLGDNFSAIDLYIAVMTNWRPRRPWYDASTPKLVEIAERAYALPELSAVWARNFSEPTD